MSIMSNNFVNMCVRIYYFSFIKKKIKSDHAYNQWLTKGIRISCKKKGFIYYAGTIMM